MKRVARPDNGDGSESLLKKAAIDSRLSSGTPVRWGLLGVGGISNDFCIGLINNKSTIAAVAARDLGRAEAFAGKVGAKRAHGSYEALVGDPEVDIVYVGTVHTGHLQHARMALQAGKHVLCEKPMCINEVGVRELVDLARSKKLFLMEAVWTRFFPAMRKVRAVLESKELGEPKYVQGNFGFVAPDDPKHRLWDPSQAGGAMLDIGIYLVQAATMVFGPKMPDQLACTGTLTSQGVDADTIMSMTWNGKGSASFITTFTAHTPQDLLIFCSEGMIKICGPAHCPSRIVLSKSQGRGQSTDEELSFDLPTCPDGMKVNYPNSEGLLYEVQAVEECLRRGQTESPEYMLEESLAVVKIMDAIRQQLGVVYDVKA